MEYKLVSDEVNMSNVISDARNTSVRPGAMNVLRVRKTPAMDVG